MNLRGGIEMLELQKKVREFSFGKIAYTSHKKINAVTVNISLTETEAGPVFAASASIWNSKETDIVCGGQIFEELFPYLKNNITFKIIFCLWSLYHLNDMHAGTEEQENALKKAGKQFASYSKQIDTLKDLGLDVVSLPDGTLYKYGEKWLYRSIPQEHLADIKGLFVN